MNSKWVFVSHSNKDYQKVRKVRNVLEDWNFRPLLFFLKCLDEDGEVSELIKREIDCRTRFLLCESYNTNNPYGWVQKEVAYIKSLDRQCDIIDIDSSEESIKYALESFKKASTIYISHSDSQYDFARMLAKRLEKYDFDAVFEPVDDLDAVINKAIRTGCFIPIVSEDYESVRFNEILGARKAHINRILEEQRNTSSYSRHVPPIISIFTFDAFSETTPCEKTIDELWDEPCVEIFGNELPTQCDMAMRFILGRFFSWGTLYAFAKNFETDADMIDREEASFLYEMILTAENKYRCANKEWPDEFTGLPGVLARCYEYGNSHFNKDLRKALLYYEEELHDRQKNCVETQRALILQNLNDNIRRIKDKIKRQENP